MIGKVNALFSSWWILGHLNGSNGGRSECGARGLGTWVAFGQSCAQAGRRLKTSRARGLAFLQTEFSEQFDFGRKADKIEVNGFHLPLGGPLAGEQHEQERGN